MAAMQFEAELFSPAQYASCPLLGGAPDSSRRMRPSCFADCFRVALRAARDMALPLPVSCCTCAFAMLAKPRFCRSRYSLCRSKIEVPLEFQGLGSLGAALWRRFFPCEFDSIRACSGCRRSVRFG